MEKNSYLNDLLRNIKDNYLRMIILTFLSFISSVIFARLMGPNIFGTYSYLMWLTGALATVLGFGFGGTITKFLPMYYFNDEFEDSKRFLKILIIIETVSVIIIIGILGITYPVWDRLLLGMDLNITYSLIFLAISTVLPATLLNLLISSIQALQRFDVILKVAIKVQIVGFITNIILLIAFKKLEYILIASFIISGYQVIIYATVIIKDFKSKRRDSIINSRKLLSDRLRITRYSIYMYINIVWQQIVFTRSEYLFLGIYAGPKEIAVYGIAYGLINTVGTIFSPIMNVINNFFSLLVARQEIKLLENTIVSITKYFIVLLLFLMTCAFAFSKIVINFVYTSQYNDVFICFLIMLVGFVILQGSTVAGSIPFLYEKQKFIVCMGIFTGIINIMIDIILIPKLGSIGAAIANASAQVFSAIIGFIYIKKITRFKFGLVKLIPSGLVSIVFSTVIGFSEQITKKMVGLICYTIVYILVLWVTKTISKKEIKKILFGLSNKSKTI